jgi:hypothetical protein
MASKAGGAKLNGNEGLFRPEELPDNIERETF